MDGLDQIYRFNPLISSSKHTRILIWRSEVASASLPDDCTSYPSPPSLTTTTTISTTITSTSGPGSSAFQRKTLAALARGRKFLSRMTSKIPGRRRRGGVCAHGAPTTSAGTASAMSCADETDADDEVCRTSMYHMLRPDQAPLEHDEAMMLLGLGLGLGGSPGRETSSPHMGSGAGEEDSGGGAGTGGKRRFKLLDTQARLLRARRLLGSHSP
ncbi:hypothetical protein ESCO_004223 [Escovopsis weberi]|uniref:Uncharacterized protein n=1 Tax=Escovopsis weberi TaxID=150374 RepID=A0A0N0RTV5_ESCWE|nr:hypothetical protein ESCO_004223 [Escovopsis weberi]